MKTATLCVEELPLRDGPDQPELPILFAPLAMEKDVVPTQSNEDHATERRLEDDDEQEMAAHTPRKPTELSAAASALGFMERMVREYTLKREIHTLIGRKQQELRHMQLLIAAYQEQLLKTIVALEEETQQQQSAEETLVNETRKRLAEVIATGSEREMVEANRTLGMLQMQRHRILRERTRLRRAVVTTRQEECEWLLKSIVAQHDQECEALLTAISNKKYLEEGSLQATLAVQITQDDPIFASVDTLFDTQPQARQLQLQLDSVEVVLSSVAQRCEELEIKHVVPNGPVPLVKRSSFPSRRQDTGFPTSDRKRIVRLGLIEGKHVRSDRLSTDLAQRHKRYTSILRDLARILGDVRTRSGRLLHQFVEKLHNDTLEHVEVVVSEVSTTGSDTDTNQHEVSDQDFQLDAKYRGDLLHERHLVSRLPSLLDSVLRDQESSRAPCIRTIERAVDSDKLPPPAMITAFAKFLVRVITTEYELLSASPSSTEELSDSGDENLDDQSFENAMDQSVLHDCVHEMVFQRITLVSYASAIDEYRFTRLDEIETNSNGFLLPWHWYHSKALLQGISPSELAFPGDAMVAVNAYLERHNQEVRHHGFLPKTLSLFRMAELETTPKGVVRAVMAGFKMLHREIVNVLSEETAFSVKPDGASRRKPQRRGSSFLNADILIPSLVLMMSRLPRVTYLDRLWHRTLLVEAFRSSALSDGGEEAYYLTCLAAAMEFINTFQPFSASISPEIPHVCSCCDELRSHLVCLSVRIQPLDAASASSSPAKSPGGVQGRPGLSRTTQAVGAWSKKEHESIKQLSKWISDQPPTEVSGVPEAERFVLVHELWSSEALRSHEE